MLASIQVASGIGAFLVVAGIVFLLLSLVGASLVLHLSVLLRIAAAALGVMFLVGGLFIEFGPFESSPSPSPTPSPIVRSTPSPTLALTPSPSPSLTPNPMPSNFVFTKIMQGDGQELPNAEPVTISVKQLPLTITGTYASQGSGQVWVVVVDRYGQYYLQALPVRFADGGQQGVWGAYNVNTNVGTVRIDFVYVTPQGNDTFQHRMDAKDFSSFTQLPNGYKLLLTINIVVNG